MIYKIVCKTQIVLLFLPMKQDLIFVLKTRKLGALRARIFTILFNQNLLIILQFWELPENKLQGGV